MKSFIQENLFHLLFSTLALALLFSEREISFGLRSQIMNSADGITPGFAIQRVIALVVLGFCARKMWLGRKR